MLGDSNGSRCSMDRYAFIGENVFTLIFSVGKQCVLL